MLQKICFLLLSVLLISGWINAQSLEQNIAKATQFQVNSIDSSIHFYRLANSQAILEKDTAHLQQIYNALSNLYNIKAQADSTEEYAKKALSISRSVVDRTEGLVLLGMAYEYSDLKKSDSLHHLAELLLDQIEDPQINYQVLASYGGLKLTMGDYYGAIDYLLKADPYAKHDLPRVVNHVKISSIFRKLKNINRSNEYLDKAIQLAEKNNFNIRYGFVAIERAKLLKSQGKIQAAKQELQKVLTFDNNQKKWITLAEAQILLTNIAIEEKDFDTAFSSNQKSLALYEKTSPHNRCSIHSNRARILIHQQQYEQAILTCKKGMAIAKKGDFKKHLASVNRLMSNAYEKNNHNDLALKHHKIYQSLHDSLYQSDKTIFLFNLEAQYNRAQQEKSIARLDAENDIQAMQLSQQNSIIAFGAAAFSLIAGLSFFLFSSGKKIKNQNAVISKNLQEKTKLLEEKDTLLKEIHHRVKNNLQLVSSLLGFQSQNIEDPKALQAINSGKARVKSMALIHQDLYNQENLKGIKVKDYFQKLCRELISTYQIDIHKIKLSTEIDNLDLDIDTIVPLGLIVNELLTNALKYAFPKHSSGGEIVVCLYQRDQKLQLEIKDNGIGMNLSDAQNESFGLKLVNTLLYQLDGTMSQRAGKGTHLILAFENYKIAA